MTVDPVHLEELAALRRRLDELEALAAGSGTPEDPVPNASPPKLGKPASLADAVAAEYARRGAGPLNEPPAFVEDAEMERLAELREKDPERYRSQIDKGSRLAIGQYLNRKAAAAAKGDRA